MLVVYTKSDNRVIGWSYKPATITEDSIISDDLKMRGVNFENVAYGYYEDKKIVRQYDEEGMELPLYMKDLDLTPAERPLSIEEEVVQLKTKMNKLDEDVKTLKLTAEK